MALPYTHPATSLYPSVENHITNDPTPKSQAVWIPSVTPGFAIDVHAQNWSRATPVPATDLNFLDPTNNLIRISHVMSSAGQASKQKKPCIITCRDRARTILYCDSGGYQIASNRLSISTDLERIAILRWMEQHGDVGMTLDVPTGPVLHDPHYRWKSTSDCLKDTLEHLDVFRRNRKSGGLKLLNVLQGNNPIEARSWYDAVKHYQFDGWAFAGPMRLDIPYLCRQLIRMADEGQLDGKPYIHILGTGELDTAVMLTAMQRALSTKFPKLRISFDTSTPFRQVGWKQVCTQPRMGSTGMTMTTIRAPDDPKLIGSDLPWPWPSPLGDHMTMGDFCVRKKPTDSDSCLDVQSYHYLSHHNLSVQCWAIAWANRIFDVQQQMTDRPPIAGPINAAVVAIDRVFKTFTHSAVDEYERIFDCLAHTHDYDTGDEERTFDYQAQQI